jgi:hypothetical protein
VARLFHALVVCGASLTLTQCGGRASGDDDAPGGSGPNTGGGPGSGGVSGTGGMPATGGQGAGGLATGGTPSYGGVGGATSDWSSQSNCPAYYCDSVLFEGRQVSAIPLNEPCPIERGRPRSVRDCGPSELFSCVLGVAPDGGSRLVNCACILPAIEECLCPAGSGCVTFQSDTCTSEINICSCALTCILR